LLRLLSRTMGNFLTYCCEYIYECYNRKSHRPQHVNKKTHTRSKRPILVLNVDNNDSVSNIVPQVEAIRDDIELHYHINSKPIGLGSSSNVYSATNKLTGSSVAIKQINFTQDQDNVLGEHQRHTICEQIEQEVVSLRSISHPHLIRLREVYQDQYSVYLVTDLYTGGELFNLVDVSGNIPEMYARKILRQILEAVQHCHENNITHRDLKLENIILDTHAIGSNIHIIDFGLSTNKPPPFNLFAGSPYYIAPEMIQRSYTNKCDIWAIGVIMYILITGTPPVNGNIEGDSQRLIRNGNWKFQHKLWEKISPDAKLLLKNLLCQDPTQRYTATQALDSKWFTDTETTHPIQSN
jgi:calcium-dependent protein kinase